MKPYCLSDRWQFLGKQSVRQRLTGKKYRVLLLQSLPQERKGNETQAWLCQGKQLGFGRVWREGSAASVGSSGVGMALLPCPEVVESSRSHFCGGGLLTVDCCGKSIEPCWGTVLQLQPCHPPPPHKTATAESHLLGLQAAADCIVQPSVHYARSTLLCISYKQGHFAGGEDALEKG